MKNSIIAIILMLVLFSCNNRKETINIIPIPNSIIPSKGSFLIDENTSIKANEDLKSISEVLLKGLTDRGIQLSENANTEKNIEIIHDTTLQLGNEGYKLIVEKNNIKIVAPTQTGLFYGVQSLLQLCDGGTKEIKCMLIEDQPAFKWRGMMLDEVRHFFGKEEVLKIIDQMASIKLNTFHWHLVDDQGWRIEIKKYPKLTEVGAWRKADTTNVWNYSSEPAEEGKPKYGGFYTQEEIKEIVAYAAARHITIIPEIEMPGHSTAAIFAYPELSCKGKPWKLGSEQSFEFSDPLCAGNDKVFEIFEGILAEVIELFPSQYIHVGGDECKKTPWEKCPKCMKRMKDENLKDVNELQSYFIKRMETFINSKGKILIGWDEILEGGLAPRAAVMSWRGVVGGIEAASHGHDVVMSPTDFCYFDYYQGNILTEPKAIGGFLPLNKVYEFNPIPQELNADKHHHVMGGQANLWTEHMFDKDYLEYMIYPRLFAMAEVLWTKKENQNYEDFLNRLPNRLLDLSRRGINYRMLSPDGLGQQLLITSDTTIEIINPMKNQGAIVYYTTDGSNPDQTSAVYQEALKISATTSLKARLFLGDKGSSISQSWIFVYNPEVNGLSVEFFKGAWSNLPNFDSLTVEKTYTAPIISAANPDGLIDDYGLRFKAKYQIDKSGEYTFYTSSDDGSRLFIDGQQIIDYDGCHGAGMMNGKITLEKGLHELELWFFEGRGGQSLEAGTINENGERIPFDPAKMFFK